MSSMVTELKVLEADSNIFDTDTEYSIPLYQRGYAWGDKQLVQLIEDIQDVQDGAEHYYIGSLIVSKQEGRYEVVDGQQRLTSLYLLLNCLGVIEVKDTLTFACRDKSNYTLRKIKSILTEERGEYDLNDVEQNIYKGIRILQQEIEKQDFDKYKFIEKLKKVVIYRIEVPEHTDLNRYFEIMNTRGEQLEQHDILKSVLMGNLPKEEHAIFAKLWDACSDMTGYVQMHFNRKVREKIFTWDCQKIPSNEWNFYKNIDATDLEDVKNQRIEDIIKPSFDATVEDGIDENDNRVRFESIIEFPYFLQHVLKVYAYTRNVTHYLPDTVLINELLDDKKLLDSYEKVIENGVISGVRINESKDTLADFSRGIIMCMLRCRFLFDRYIIKREYANDNSDGEWSLKELCTSTRYKDIRVYYRNTSIRKSKEWDTTNSWRVKTNIMIQSALRVSYTSPKVMHWITELLKWLSEKDCINTKEDYIVYYSDQAVKIAKKAVLEQFIKPGELSGFYAMGVNTPHIVFNYLDYLLWEEDRYKGKPLYADFEFEFRNSVEHWYPQNPSEGTFDSWKDGVDQFGNLCIIQRNVNSKFSNMAPEAKKSTFEDMINKGSIKLRIMRDLTVAKDGMHASKYWKEVAYKEHEEEMIEKLKKACCEQQSSSDEKQD